jgi:hypothetical protein
MPFRMHDIRRPLTIREFMLLLIIFFDKVDLALGGERRVYGKVTIYYSLPDWQGVCDSAEEYNDMQYMDTSNSLLMST